MSDLAIFESYDEFIDAYNQDPIDTLNRLSVHRETIGKTWNKHTNKSLQKKLEEGSTLEEFFELISLNQNENLDRLMNTWLSFKDLIEEEKGTFTIKDGVWRIDNPKTAYLDLKNKPLNNLEVSEEILEKFFKCYSPLSFGDKYEITLEYDKKIYHAHIIKTDEKLLFHWDEKFMNILKKMYANFDLDSLGNESKIDYLLGCRFYWNRYYKGISVYLDIHEIMIQISDDVNNEVLIPKTVMNKFFSLEDENVNYKGEPIEINLEKDYKARYKGYIKNYNNQFFLKWDEKFISWLNREYQEVIDVKNILFIKLKSKSDKPGEWYNLLFDFITIEKNNNNIIQLSPLKRIDGEHENTSLSIEDYSLVEEFVEYSSAEDKEDLRKKILEVLMNLESKQVLTSDSKGQSRAEQYVLRALLYGNKKTSACEYCKKEFPVTYMKTAHIKKRKFTSNEEKLDANIVFALCPTCDIAFENGDIYVEKGYFKVNSKKYPDDLADYLYAHNNSMCECYNEKNERYFKWHKDHHLKTMLT